MSVKKAVIITSSILAVLMLVIASAGCIEQKTNPVENTIDFSKIEVAEDDYILKTGTTYNIGDTMEVRLPAEPLLGIDWTVKSCDNGLSIKDEGYTPLDYLEIIGFRTFTITACDEGEYAFTVVNQSGGEYSDTMQVVKTNAEPLRPRGIFYKEPLLEGTDAPGRACVGQAYRISIYGYPGDNWTLKNTDGLIISDMVYTPDITYEIDGFGGWHTWLITSTTPGRYVLTAFNSNSIVSEEDTEITLKLKFSDINTK